MTRNAIISKRIPLSQTTLSGIDVISARRLYSLSKIPNTRVYCLFCLHIGKVRDFAQIDSLGELERLFRCPECLLQMTKTTLINSFTPKELGYYIGYYDRFWSRVSNHNQWGERFKLMFTYEERQQFWDAYYEVRPKHEKSVSDNQ